MTRLLRGLLLVLLVASSQASTQTLNMVRQGLVDDIQQAQATLSETERTIAGRRQSLSQQINRSQNTVLDLRERTVAARRLADEETLSLGQIESRLNEWQNQRMFQNRLLAGFLTRLPAAATESTGNGAVDSSAQALRNYLQGLHRQLYPAWKESQVVLPDGRIERAEILQVGPLAWYAREHEQEPELGLAAIVNSALPQVVLPLRGTPLASLQALKDSGRGSLTFDPTLSPSTLATVESDGIVEHVRKGGIWVVPILAFALFATITALLKALALARLPQQEPALAERLELAMANDTSPTFRARLTGAQAELVQITLDARSAEQREERLYACLLDRRSHLEKWLGAIALTAAVAPLLGLLGTVSGMITTFKLMTLFGAGDAASVSAGISEALVTTELGLVVAIPALIAHALMSRKVKAYYSQLESTAIRLSQIDMGAR